MSNTPWNCQGAQAVPMNGINQALGWGRSMSQYYHQDGNTYRAIYDWPTSSTQGARGLSGMTSKAYVYIYGQGGTFGSPNGYTNIFFNSPDASNLYTQCFQSIYLQQNYNTRCWMRSFRQTTGYGGSGGRNWQGNANNPPAYAGSPGVSIQGYVSEFRWNSQGYYIVGGGGGGGAGAQGSRANQGLLIQTQFSPSGGGSGGGGGGYGPGGTNPDARYQGQYNQGGGAYTGGAGGAGGGGNARAGGAGGNSGNWGTGGQNGGGGAGPGQGLSWSAGYQQITY